MNKRLIGVLIFAFVVSAGASFILYRVISSRISMQQQAPQTQILVAARNLPIGTLIKDVDVKLVDWSGSVPAQALTKQEDTIGRGVVAEIYEGEPLLESRLAARGAGAGLAAIIPSGMRAVAVRVNDVTSLAGYVTPGMRVDILILGTPPNANQSQLGTQTKTLLQNIAILSAGQQIQKDAEGKPIPVTVVNVLVTPEQAEILSLASQDARIQLVLRNPLDTEQAKTTGTAMARIWAGQPGMPVSPAVAPRPRLVKARLAPPPVAPVKEKIIPPLIVEIIHGGKSGVRKIEMKFKDDSEEK